MELHAALLQGAVTAGIAVVCWTLYLRYRGRALLWWTIAWSLYVLRIFAIIAFLETRAQPWLFAHQVLTGATALVLLWAAHVYTQATRWRPWYALAMVFPLGWSYVAIYRLESFMLAAVPAVLFLSFATLWTGAIFLRRWRAQRSRGAAVLGAVLVTWGIHHLDYPVLRAMGSWNPWGYYLDILFVLAMAIGIVILVLEELDSRTSSLEKLSARLLAQHEEERRRVSLELHDQTAQVWSAVKMQLGLVRESAPRELSGRLDRVLDLVDTGIHSIRSVTTNLRPPLLDDLGLVPALRSLVQSFASQSNLAITFDAPAEIPPLSADASVALFRALQEALANVSRHSGASRVRIQLSVVDNELRLLVRDNGRGFPEPPAQQLQPVSLGLAGMRERIGALRGSVSFESDSGASVTVRLPLGDATG